MPETLHYYNILLCVPTDGVYTYASEGLLTLGERVVVPFGKRDVTGIVYAETTKPEFDCKQVLMKYDEEPLFNNSWLQFITALSNYYCTPLGVALQGVISDKLLNTETADELSLKEHPIKNITLTDTQQDIVDTIEYSKFSRHLIHGITGSGKTEVYLEAAKKVIEKGKQVLYIVPEISLTPQLIERISSRFGHEPLIFHSKLTDKKRRTTFLSFAKGDAKFLIGARSALFIPAKDIGLIIVDEEHEQSYKQDEAPAYHLRDMAIMYAQILDIPIIMGSATPSVESMHNVETGKYILHKMLDRPNDAKLPDIEIIDVKKHDIINGMMAEPMFDKLSETVKRGEQAILFLNRKGYSTSLYCKRCGEPATCANCSIGLVYYKSKNTCTCRYCDTDYRNITCKTCGSIEYTEWGAGTEKVAEFMEEMFPNNVIRLDTDNVTSLKSLAKSLKQFENKEAQILVGTQLIAKGLHFPDVTFVGVLGIDNILSMNDFRATERAYQLLVQVSGRAGREALSGKVCIQTMSENSPIFHYITENTPDDFYKFELARREITMFPPYTRLARLLFTHTDYNKVRDAAKFVCKMVRDNCPEVIVYGPAEADIVKIKNKHRFSVLIKAKTHNHLSHAIKLAQYEFNNIKKGAMMLKVDKDPYFLS